MKTEISPATLAEVIRRMAEDPALAGDDHFVSGLCTLVDAFAPAKYLFTDREADGTLISGFEVEDKPDAVRLFAARIIDRGTEKDPWFVCPCGNEPEDDGFYACDDKGIPVTPTAAQWTSGLYVCTRCGVFFRGDTLVIVGVSVLAYRSFEFDDEPERHALSRLAAVGLSRHEADTLATLKPGQALRVPLGSGGEEIVVRRVDGLPTATPPPSEGRDPRADEAQQHADTYTVPGVLRLPPTEEGDDAAIKTRAAAGLQKAYDAGGTAGFFELGDVRRTAEAIEVDVTFERAMSDDLDIALKNYPGESLAQALKLQLDGELREAAGQGHFTTPFTLGEVAFAQLERNDERE